MVITLSNISYYLLERGLLSKESVVDGDLVIVEATRRNRNFKVMRRHQPSYFLKQIQTWEQQAIATLQREATCYSLAQSEPDLAPLAALLPACHLYDPVRHVLVTELLPESESLGEYHRRLNKFPVELASQLGRALGIYHHTCQGATFAKLKEKLQNAAFPQQIPWILVAHQQSAQFFQALSAGNAELVGLLQKYPEFQQALDELRQNWHNDTLMHGDMKWENCVVWTTGTNGAAEMKLKLVDWELADLGDACWDVGAIFQAYLSCWITSIPVNPGTPAAQLLHLAQYPLEAMIPAIHAFWQAYLETRQITGAAAQELLERCVKYGAARMIQTAYEYLQYSPQITPQTLYLLQVSMNILKSPKEAIFHLLEL